VKTCFSLDEAPLDHPTFIIKLPNLSAEDELCNWYFKL